MCVIYIKGNITTVIKKKSLKNDSNFRNWKFEKTLLPIAIFQPWILTKSFGLAIFTISKYLW